MHFQFAHWAWDHPLNLLDHWAKPVFTLIAAPFAAFGFAGMKFLQCLLVLGTGFFVWRIAGHFKFKFAWAAPVLAFAAPELFLSQLSGLTEPMFGFFLCLGIWLMLRQRLLLAALLLSCLPFIRTEGFLLLPTFGLYLLLIERNWRATLLLAATTVLYSLVGGIVFGDLLWIWTKNPYAGPLDNYGAGNWTHFIEQYLFVVGIPIYGLTILGLLTTPFQIIRRKVEQKAAFLLLILAPFAIYFGAHVIFWATGTGHSMGLIRVLIAIVPLGAIIALLGLETLLAFIPPKVAIASKVLLGLILAYACLFPLLPNPASIKAKDLQLSADQRSMQNAAEWMKDQALDDRTVFSAYPATAYYLNTDPFDTLALRPIIQIDKGEVPIGSIIVWDNWFGELEGGITPRFLNDNAFRFKPLQSWKSQDGKRSHEIALFEKI